MTEMVPFQRPLLLRLLYAGAHAFRKTNRAKACEFRCYTLYVTMAIGNQLRKTFFEPHFILQKYLYENTH